MQGIINENKEFILGLWDRIEKKITVTSDRIKDGMPYTTREGIYDNWEDNKPWWTNTFWCGILWLMYKETKEEKYKKFAESIEEKMDSVLYGYDAIHHDVGFMWLLSSVMNYEITGNEASRKRSMIAASLLSSRANIKGEFIRAWNGDKNGWAIIDCMMNIPLLYWASDQTKDNRFRYIAEMHADKVTKTFVREDDSVHHIVGFDEKNGDVLETPQGGGYEVGSSWARGQSWAVYGFAQSYNSTKEKKYLDVAKRVAHYVLANLAINDFIPLCDFRQPEEVSYLDSSTGAITACGLIEIAKAVPENEKALYIKSAIKILKTLDEKCTAWGKNEEALLVDGSSSTHTGGFERAEVFNGALIYGDYYFMEVVCKLKEMI